MKQPRSDNTSQRKEEKEPYITPELVAQEPLQDITMQLVDDSGGMTQIDPPSLQLK